MNVSGVGHSVPLSIYCSVEEHDTAKRREYMEQLTRLGIQPEIKGDKVEVRYRGSRNTVMKLAAYAESHTAHSIHITLSGA